MKLAVVGVGAGVFHLHRPSLQQPDVTLVGVCDVDAERGRARASELGCPFFVDHRDLLAATRPDAVVVLTPHPFHARVAIDCLAAGAHVLVEKPMAVQVADADKMVDAAATAGRSLAVNFQHRHRPDIRAARELIRSGQLGEIQRVETVAVWTRTAWYYERAAWRGTWAGEGGGVLMNQAAHNLDLLCYLAGRPSRVVAWNRAMLHHVEVEDTAAALLEWPNGALGTLYVTTAQVGEPERIEIVGTGGVLQIGRDGLRVQRAEVDLRTFVAECPLPIAAPDLQTVHVERPSGRGDHAAVYANFLRAMRGAEPLVCDGIAGRESLELGNALILSSHRGCPVELPLDRAAYAHLLDELQAECVR